MGRFPRTVGCTGHMVERFQNTEEEQSDPTLVDYWKTPFKLAKRESNAKAFFSSSRNRSIGRCQRKPI
ncbi:hypothetical protein BDD14_0443 [Edaphobacter modestus]|uniref:Uncharacterized protein n=1 Tax=Edaphobacter modestus TaxID=388466 RepID=A0A4Q7YQG4_9BACT|nr:hypothetical protein BDD14_0443 [Edaphobacter modestus]